MTETIPSQIEVIGTFEFRAAKDKRGREYILITVNVGNVTSMLTSTAPDRATTIATNSLRELTGEKGELFFRCISDTTECQEWEAGTAREAA